MFFAAITLESAFVSMILTLPSADEVEVVGKQAYSVESLPKSDRGIWGVVREDLEYLGFLGMIHIPYTDAFLC